MIPAGFDYLRPDTVEGALAALADHGEDAKLLAGGHSLLPLLKLRLAEPSVLIDIGRLSELSFVRAEADHIAIGPLTRHRDLETSEVLAAHAPLLRHAAHQVGDPQVRHRGTIGGSIAHGDPASDLPAVLLALGATVVARGPAGDRTIAADDLFVSFLETALAPGELLVEIRVPKTDGAGWSFQKFNRRAQDWAIVGVACQSTGGGARVGLVNMAPTPVRARAVEDALAQGATAAAAAALAGDGAAPSGDQSASVEFRHHLARVLVERALDEAGAGA